jgi:hypothetical protein
MGNQLSETQKGRPKSLGLVEGDLVIPFQILFGLAINLLVFMTIYMVIIHHQL